MKLLSQFIAAMIFGFFIHHTAIAQTPFVDIPLSDLTNMQDHKEKTEIRSRYVKIDNLAAKNLFANKSPAQKLSLSLFPGLTVKLKQNGFDPDLDKDAKAWTGRSEGIEDGFAALVYRKNRITGHVQYGGKFYQIHPGSNGIHKISEQDTSKMPTVPETDLISVPSHITKRLVKDPKTSIRPNITPVPNSRIRIFYLATEGAENERLVTYPTLREEALLSLAILNGSMENTGLRRYRFKFAGMRRTYCQYDDVGKTIYDFLEDITDKTTCIGTKAAQHRETFNADIVVGIRRLRSAQGTFAAFDTDTLDPDLGYAAVTRGIGISGNGTGHAVGHVLGLRHERTQYNPAPPIEAYNFAYIIPVPERPDIYTIMARIYARVPVYSNTHKLGKWEGNAMGRGLHTAAPAVNRKTIINNWNIVADYR